MSNALYAGVAETDITPPVGTLMAGSLKPRPSTGITDPLMLKVLVLQRGETRMAYAIFDLAVLDRVMGERMVARAAERSGIPADHIIWSCSHTHSGPCTMSAVYPDDVADPVDGAWMTRLVDQFVGTVALAAERQVPVRASRTRGYFMHLGHYRRLAFKDGRHLNTWLLNRGEEDVQCVGTAGPLDPEVGVLAFEDERGRPVAILFNVAIHANAHFGNTFSGDYPAVVAARLREHYGPRVLAFYMPGACGNINPNLNYRDIGNTLADIIIERMTHRVALPDPPDLVLTHRIIDLPLRDPGVDQEERIRASQWGADGAFFRHTQQAMRRQGQTMVSTVLHAWRLGDVAFPTLPGEAFVEMGLRIKRESACPWTYPVELCGDWLGYLVPPEAHAAGGYESLVSSVGRVAPDGCDQLVDTQLQMIDTLMKA